MGECIFKIKSYKRLDFLKPYRRKIISKLKIVAQWKVT